MPYIHDGETLYVDAAKEKVVKEGDPEAAFVLVGPGGTLPDADAEKYGLKASKAPQENKMLTPAENKAPSGVVTRGPVDKLRVVDTSNANAMGQTQDVDMTPVDGGEVDATPAARELAEEAGVNLADVEGTGEGGRVLKGDVEEQASARQQRGKRQ